MGRVSFVVDAGKTLAGFGLGFALLLAGLLSLAFVGGEHVSVALGDGLVFVALGGKLLSIVLGAVGIAGGTALVRWAENNRRAVVRDRGDPDEAGPLARANSPPSDDRML